MLKKKLFLFALFVLLVFALLSYQSMKNKSLSVDFSFHPLRMLEQAASYISDAISNAINSYLLIVGKEAENRRLIKTVEGHNAELIKLKELELENERLRKVLKLKSRRKDFVVAADIYARDPTNWFQVFWINKGRVSGIDKDMVAITSAGPVGKVDRVFEHDARITLITDVNSSVAARLQDSRLEGMFEGRGDDTGILKYISKDAEVSLEEKVLTSGLDGLYPKGLLLGYVSKVSREEGEMFKLIEVRLAQDLSAAEEVIILKR